MNIYEKIIETDFFKYDSNGFGAFLFIQNNSYLESYNPIFTTPGLKTNIPIDREFKSILPKPYSNCDIDSSFESDSELYNLIQKSKYQYTQQFCLSQCFQRYLINNFNCTTSYIVGFFNNTNVCDEIAFLLSQNSTFIDDYLTNICIPMCPLECNQTLIKTSISSVLLVGDGYLSRIKNSNLSTDFINRTIDAATVEKSIVHVNIFYESLSYTETTESPQMNIVSLLGSIGGHLGLFLGVSIFSLCEIIEVLIEIYFIIKGRGK